jgi:hypothetical protein
VLHSATDDAADTQAVVFSKGAEGFGVGKAGAQTNLDSCAQPTPAFPPLSSGFHWGRVDGVLPLAPGGLDQRCQPISKGRSVLKEPSLQRREARGWPCFAESNLCSAIPP